MAKGGDFEREVGRLLSLWLTHGKENDLMRRTECSGGRFTMTARGDAGDLMSTGHPVTWNFFQHYTVECKHWNCLDLWNFLLKRGELYEAMEKVKKQATDLGRQWMLIVRQNWSPILVFMPTAIFPDGHPSPHEKWHLLFDGEVYFMRLKEMVEIPLEQFPYLDYGEEGKKA